MRTILEGPFPGVVCPAAEVRPITIPCALKTGAPEIQGLISMSEARLHRSIALTSPEAVSLSGPIGLLTAVILSPTATLGGLPSAWAIVATTQSGQADRFAHRRAMSFSSSEARSVAATLCWGSN